jgi:hypothetical protein
MWVEVCHSPLGCFDAQRSAAGSLSCDQHGEATACPTGHARCAARIGVPQGTRNFDERSAAKVYGATPSTAEKETTTLPKMLLGGGRSLGSRSPSGESPKASWGAATKSLHPTISVERGEA